VSDKSRQGWYHLLPASHLTLLKSVAGTSLNPPTMLDFVWNVPASSSFHLKDWEPQARGLLVASRVHISEKGCVSVASRAV
jgi:hypothetical protein